MADPAINNRDGSNDAARYWIDQGPDGYATVTIRSAYASGLAPSTAERVWRVASGFGAIKVLFPSLLRLYLPLLMMVTHRSPAPRHDIRASARGTRTGIRYRTAGRTG